MKYVIPFLFLFISCKPKTGTIAGNVFWKYNNFVGNKPDAGSLISLYGIGDTVSIASVRCDVQGNFIFEQVPIGEYFLVAYSKNTNASPDEHVRSLRSFFSYRDNSSASIKFDSVLQTIDSLQRMKYDLFDKYKNLSYDDQLKEERRLQEMVDSVSIHFLSGLTNKDLFPIPYANKKHYEHITVEATKTAQAIIDFGTTFSR